MKINDKVIITGGTTKDWEKYGKPRYMNNTFTSTYTDNPICKAQRYGREMKIKSIADTIQESAERTYILQDKKGNEYGPFAGWELKEITKKDMIKNSFVGGVSSVYHIVTNVIFYHQVISFVVIFTIIFHTQIKELALAFHGYLIDLIG